MKLFTTLFPCWIRPKRTQAMKGILYWNERQKKRNENLRLFTILDGMSDLSTRESEQLEV